VPERFREALDNVTVVVETRPQPADFESSRSVVPLYGIYRGVPLTERAHGYVAAAPDVIAVFRRPLLRDFGGRRRLRREIRLTVLHELGHYFGLDEAAVEHL
jgi:predicted Zn-dependent protease with MMP-like domain